MARARSAHFEVNRESIVRAAAALFARQGYPGTSMSDVARACGISKPLLYHYVDDKYQLLREICRGHVMRLEDLVDEVDALDLDSERLCADDRPFRREYARHGTTTAC